MRNETEADPTSIQMTKKVAERVVEITRNLTRKHSQ